MIGMVLPIQSYFWGTRMVKKLSLVLVLAGLTPVGALPVTYQELREQIYNISREAFILNQLVFKYKQSLWKEVESKETTLIIQGDMKAQAALWQAYSAQSEQRSTRHLQEAEQEWLVRCQQVGVQQALDSSRYDTMRQKKASSK